MSYMLERDAINGKDGKATILRDGKLLDIFNARNIQVNADLQSEDFVVVGTRIVQTKTTGIRYQGSMEIYYGSPIFLDMLMDYQNGNGLPYFTLNIENDDKTATVGTQTVALYDCKLSGNVPIAKLDASSNQMTETVNFSFSRVEVLNKFKDPESFGG